MTAPTVSKASANPSCTNHQLLRRRRSSVQPNSAVPLSSTTAPFLSLSRELRRADITATSVWTARVAVTASVPFGVTDVGLMTHAALAGIPVQVRLTAWLNPPDGVTVMVVLVALPSVTVPLAGETDSAKLCGMAALIVTDTAVEAEAEKLAVAPYDAVIECVPTARELVA